MSKQQMTPRGPPGQAADRLLLGVLTWVIVLIFFFPVLWMALTGLKTETDANTSTPHFIFKPTFARVQVGLEGGRRPERPAALPRALGHRHRGVDRCSCCCWPCPRRTRCRSVRSANGGTCCSSSSRPRCCRSSGRSSRSTSSPGTCTCWTTSLLLIILYTAMNLPIAVWMLRSFLLEVPAEVIEASRVDGAGVVRQLRTVIMPIISPGLAATALICFIFAWNEFFLAVNLTTINGATVPIYLVGFVQPEGPFLAHLSAAATIACLPVLLAGWAAQDKLVRGLSHGRGQVMVQAQGDVTCERQSSRSPTRSRWSRVDDPAPGPREVVVDVAACGICGTDLHILEGEFAPTLPIIPGHEFAGVVVATGADVTRARRGPSRGRGSLAVLLRVPLLPARARTTCASGGMRSGSACPGGAAEFAVAPVANCVPLPGPRPAGGRRADRAAVLRDPRLRRADAPSSARTSSSTARGPWA